MATVKAIAWTQRRRMSETRTTGRFWDLLQSLLRFLARAKGWKVFGALAELMLAAIVCIFPGRFRSGRVLIFFAMKPAAAIV